MAGKPNPLIRLRKEPRQARSTELVAAVLEAAAQVLAAEGAGRFTVARVAAKAGASVGSIYQYFPNKAAILFRLQQDEWRCTTELLQSILSDASVPPSARLRKLVHAFLLSECDEADMRTALKDAAPLYRASPEVQDTRDAGTGIYRRFVDEFVPDVSPVRRAMAAELIGTTLSQVGKHLSTTSGIVVEAYAEAIADMFCAYLGQLR